MNNQVWNHLHDYKRTMLIEKCGWTNSKGTLTPMGKRIYRSEWFDLSEAARNVITRKYQELPQ